MSMIVIMPGGFHPFHAGHFALYQSAKKKFPNADLYVAATNDQSERPFPFQLKEKLAKLAGVEAGHFIQVKSPFQAKEITQNYNPESDVLVFVRSEKDRNEPPKPGGTKKDGSPAYFQPYTGKDLQPFAKHAYIDYLPTVEFGPGITSATQIRKAWPTLNDKRKLALVMSLYPATQKNPKLAQTVVGMFDQVMGGQLNEFASGNGDDGLPYAEFVVYQCDPKDQFDFIGGPLYQTDNLGMAHKYAYEMFLKHRPKAFMIYQPHIESSRGNYGVKGESDEEKLDEEQNPKIDLTPNFPNYEKLVGEFIGAKGGKLMFNIVDAVLKPGVKDTEKIAKAIANNRPIMMAPNYVKNRKPISEIKDEVDEGKVHFTDPNAKVSVFYKSPKLQRENKVLQLATDIPYKILDRFIDMVCKKYNIEPTEIFWTETKKKVPESIDYIDEK